jgi:hypothetical protein
MFRVDTATMLHRNGRLDSSMLAAVSATLTVKRLIDFVKG